MSTITVVDNIGGLHRFEDVADVNMSDDGGIVIRDVREPRRNVGAFAAGHWSSWRRLADDPSAPAHRTHVHLADRAADLVE